MKTTWVIATLLLCVACAANAQTNQLSNGDFESGSIAETYGESFSYFTGWVKDDCPTGGGAENLTASSAAARNGSNGLQWGSPIGWRSISGCDPGEDPLLQLIHDTGYAEGSTSVTFSGYADVSGLDSALELKCGLVTFTAGFGALITEVAGTTLVGGVSGWQEFTVTLTFSTEIQTTCIINPRLYIRATGQPNNSLGTIGAPTSVVYLDDLSVTYAGAAEGEGEGEGEAPITPQWGSGFDENTLLNPGFEDGTIADAALFSGLPTWFMGGAGGIASATGGAARTGSFGAEVTPGAAGSQMTAYAQIPDAIFAVGGNIATFSGYVNVSGLDPLAGLKVIFVSTAGGGYADTEIDGGTAGWQSFDLTIPFAPSALFAIFFEVTGAPGATDTYFVDDLSLSYNSDPPLPLAGILGLAVLAGISAVSGARMLRKQK